MTIDIFEKRDINDFSQSIRNVFNLITISRKYTVVGSASLKNIRFISDYDLNEIFECNMNESDCLDKVYTLFRDKFVVAKSNPNWFIIDFKCGEDSNAEPLRWDMNDIEKGYKLLENGNKIKFTECILMKSTMKLDMIAMIDGLYHEFSDNYYIKIGQKSNFFLHDIEPAHVLNNLKHDFSFYFYSQKNYFKAMKRAFSFWMLEGKIKNKIKIKHLFELFNSQVGLLYKLFGEINTIELVIENTFRKPKKEDLNYNIQSIINKIQSLHLTVIISHLQKSINATNTKTMVKHLNEAKNLFFKIINDATLQFLKKYPDYILV
jgi:hypothetical protein